MSLIPPPVEGAAPVAFDPATALALAESLDHLAWQLDHLRVGEGEAFDRAMEDWRGRAAVWAARKRPDLIEQVQRLARRFDDAAADARAAVARAAELQASRNAAATVARQQAEARAALGEARLP